MKTILFICFVFLFFKVEAYGNKSFSVNLTDLGEFNGDYVCAPWGHLNRE